MRQLLALTLIVGAFVGTNAQEIHVEHIEGITVTDTFDLRKFIYSDAKAGSVRAKAKRLAGSTPAVSYQERIGNMPQYLHDFVNEFARATQEVLAGGDNWLSDPSLAQAASNAYYYPLKVVSQSVPFTFPAGSDQNTIVQAAKDACAPYINAEYSELKSFVPYAFLCINFDHPEAFWVNLTYSYGYSSAYSFSYYPSGSGTATYTLTLMFHLLTSGGYDIRNNGIQGYDFRYPEQLHSGVQFFKTSIKNIVDQCPADGTRYEKLLAAHDWLTLHNCYNPFFAQGYSKDQIGDTPWSPLSALEGNTGQKAPVCEGYSRAFKVLCKEMGIPCILMSGNARSNAQSKGEGHMWDYVQMEDGRWYAVDVTWDDPIIGGTNSAISGQESHKWFLTGSQTDMGGGFAFIDSHPEEWSRYYETEGGTPWQTLPGPELSSAAYTPKQEELAGDINADGKVDIADAVCILNMMAEGTYSLQADINADDKIDIADFVSILNLMAEQ